MRMMTYWGVGPLIFAPAVVVFGLAIWASWEWPEYFVIHEDALFWLRMASVPLLLFGCYLYVSGARYMHRAFSEKRLETRGPYSLVRNPLYAAWLVCLFPGLFCLTGAWPVLLAIPVGYVFFFRLIHHEEEYLEVLFGDEYRRYRARVHPLIPFL